MFQLNTEQIIHISELNVFSDLGNIQQEKITFMLKSELLQYGKDFYSFKQLKEVYNWRYNTLNIKNDFSAYELCDTFKIDYLLYGFIDIKEGLYKADLKLFSKKSEASICNIFYKGYFKNQQEFFTDLALEIDKQIRVFFKKKIPEPVNNLTDSTNDINHVNKTGYLSIYNAAGYFLPIGRWNEILTGIINLETGFKVECIKPFVLRPHFLLSMRPGLAFSYSTGINKPSSIDVLYQIFHLKFPAELYLLFNNRLLFFGGIGSQLQINFYSIQRKNDYRYLTSPAFSLFFNTGFEVYFGKNKLVGIGNSYNFDFSFYDVFYIDYKVQLYSCIRFKLNNSKGVK